MTATTQKLENTLKRAEQLISVNEKAEALNVLHAIIIHRRLRANGWDTSAEQIVTKFIHLCVELDKLKYVREGLHSYRVLTQQHNVLSLVKVMKELRDASEKKLELAKTKASNEATLPAGVDDLEADESPECLMLSTLQVEVRDKTAKELYAALLGCWETYKIIMDLLRFCPKIDYFYHDTARRALEFCLLNKRPQEFRRLCDTLRLHYANFQKYRSRPDFESFLRPESHIPIRLTQMDVAAELGLWTQCFQTAEDIIHLGLHDMLQRSLYSKDSAYYQNRSVFLSQTSRFYEKLARVFKVSGQWTLHASAILRNLFHTRQHKRSVTKEEQVQLSSIAVIAILCVPILQKNHQGMNDIEYQKKLTNMLGQGCFTTRASMQSIIETRGILSAASPQVERLYRHVEGEVVPMTYCSKAEELINQVKKEMTLCDAYLMALKRVIFDRLMLQLENVYTSMSIDFFTTCVCKKSFFPWSQAEVILVQLIQDGFLHLRLDYSEHALIFGDVLKNSDLVEDNRFYSVANVFNKIVLHHPDLKAFSSPCNASLHYTTFYSNFEEKLRIEEKRLEKRNRAIIECRLRQLEKQSAEEEARKTKEIQKQRQDEEEEQKRREAALLLNETIRRREAYEQLMLLYGEQIVAEFKAMAEKANGKIIHKGKPIEDITTDDILTGKYDHVDYETIQEELRTKEKQERSRQHRQESKRAEHLVRALREEESQLIKIWKEKVEEEDRNILKEKRAQFEKQYAKFIEERNHQKNVLKSVRKEFEAYFETCMEKRREAWEQQCRERLEKTNKILKQRKIERAKVARQLKELQRAEEEKRQEEERLLAEARAKKEFEERQELEKEAMRKRVEEKQREKDLEIERRFKQMEKVPRTSFVKVNLVDDLDWSRKAVITRPAVDDAQTSANKVIFDSPTPKVEKYIPPHSRMDSKTLQNTSRVRRFSELDRSLSNKNFTHSVRSFDKTVQTRKKHGNASNFGLSRNDDVEIVRHLPPNQMTTPSVQNIKSTIAEHVTKSTQHSVGDGFTTVTKKLKPRSPK
ncbi:uncharacterized protein LOC128883294 [Hylaeus volcanicus]|uniref:uncharacterized protein LOC128883294 n=1 Tax=Hylaeus volcanicus TaxID=313075 RepID=UPI0023B7B0FB|nr:uncharacterized protein LOC128883294 [Hylaeus volcanicus]XP_053991473.1 uncharacterized protein LOC128883294 [Hylaeus volcanicus]XP_053991474.1 uncharacterized protein LOC128883294 [Hylaeus volcanicus]XP_053991475.1 uncharacterized protein LOC128883294 [Hylaeus volcanicus]